MLSSDRLAVHGNGHAHSGSLEDFSGFSNENVEHDSVDQIVRAVEQYRFNLLTRLPVPIYAPFTLLQPIGVPRQVVMEHSIKMVL
jgi:hypothetical protein